ncbi:MAG: hypothetical protein ACRC80_19775 [Waterburya sp.]
MWTINSSKICTLRTPGGDRFTEFVNALITVEAYTKGLPLSNISTTLRTNIADKGVDAEVRQPASNSFNGWMDVPTCWQYKATEYSNISEAKLREEIKGTTKEYARKLIQNGYGYRFCICDAPPANKTSEWENLLDDEIAKINPNAPKSKVITASDLATWANQYPAIIVKFFQPQFVNSLALEDWGRSITGLTFEYVEVNLWTSITQRIIEHINFNNSPNSVTLTLQGEAGVGKTRFIYEKSSIRMFEWSFSYKSFASSRFPRICWVHSS